MEGFDRRIFLSDFLQKSAQNFVILRSDQSEARISCCWRPLGYESRHVLSFPGTEETPCLSSYHSWLNTCFRTHIMSLTHAHSFWMSSSRDLFSWLIFNSGRHPETPLSLVRTWIGWSLKPCHNIFDTIDSNPWLGRCVNRFREDLPTSF